MVGWVIVDYLIYLLVGTFSGVLAGLLGVGGGLVIVPALIFVFHAQGNAPELISHMAIGTSLAVIVPTAISSVRAHHARGAVNRNVLVKLAPGLVLGAIAGAIVAHHISSDSLKMIFGVFEIAVAVQILIDRSPRSYRLFPDSRLSLLIGAGIGSVSSLLGIGGGTLSVPTLLWFGRPMREAIGTSAACGLPIALAGVAGFVLSGWNVPGLPEYTSGYVFLPALALISVASVLAAPVGAHLAHRLPVGLIKKFFAVFLVVVGVRLLI